MPKKVISFSLEEDLIEFIDEVQKEKKLSSRSAALERILITKKIENENVEDILRKLLKEKETIDDSNEEKNNEEKNKLDEVALNAMNDIFKDMKDKPE